MKDFVQTTVKCQDPGDGSADVIIELSDDVLERMGLQIADSLTIELIGGIIVLKPVRGADAQP
ncbi:AbrB/MazE/SpoVT family DNA-binding domain-containing protein [Pseudomonas sp. B21-023]|uniref:AbrB/MazE/SpoVT family DNA-binding domain-containing protein n=1 Tax=unclassified Pseudomonas TaxID=196821 RepID=UPI001554EB05|nr:MULTISPECIES: AbrB/MazE/SpoVT family DNA-binding domain-containing protein [unclassified Pseudomonas]NQD75315.1 AbrB/MazE/SpoVT family DNA-binding domain-containing protein [Pseudomonas sp. CM27]UVM14356.1 AbrB/MazE/SpoVT family DNA-binding domain-containing protein [Pseudomonas sp. B21-023]